jgi:hypothetical protein
MAGLAVLGFLLLLTGLIMNIQVLRRSRSLGIQSADLMRMPPWLISVGLIVVGIILVIVH